MNPNQGHSPASPVTEHRGWSVKMIVWSAAFAAFLLLAAWGAANWRVFDLAYCKHLMRSSDPLERLKGQRGVAFRHLKPGMTRDHVAGLVSPTQIGPGHSPTDICVYLERITYGRRYGQVGMVFDLDNRLVEAFLDGGPADPTEPIPQSEAP